MHAPSFVSLLLLKIPFNSPRNRKNSRGFQVFGSSLLSFDVGVIPTWRTWGFAHCYPLIGSYVHRPSWPFPFASSNEPPQVMTHFGVTSCISRFTSTCSSSFDFLQTFTSVFFSSVPSLPCLHSFLTYLFELANASKSRKSCECHVLFVDIISSNAF